MRKQTLQECLLRVSSSGKELAIPSSDASRRLPAISNCVRTCTISSSTPLYYTAVNMLPGDTSHTGDHHICRSQNHSKSRSKKVDLFDRRGKRSTHSNFAKKWGTIDLLGAKQMHKYIGDRFVLPEVSYENKVRYKTTHPFTTEATGASRNLLHYEWIVNGKISKIEHEPRPEVVLFLHGLLGSGKNLRTLAKRFTLETGKPALLLDLRGHGQSNYNVSKKSSVGHEAPHSIYNCSMDVIKTMKALNLVGDHSPVGVVGHSFGGRTALSYHHTTLRQQLNQNHLQEMNDSEFVSSRVLPPQQCWILDSCPGNAHASVAEVIEAVSSIQMPVRTKKELVDKLRAMNISKAIASWMTTNLQMVNKEPNRGQDGCEKNSQESYEFMFDLDVVKGILKDFPEQDMLRQIRECIQYETPQQSSVKKVIHKVIAGKNGAWNDEILDELKDIQREAEKLKYADHDLKMTTLDTGHWVHVDELDSLIKTMAKEFSQF